MASVTEISVVRGTSKSGTTVGKLTMPGFSCYTLEDEVREVKGQPVSVWKIDGQTAIPSGRYKVTIDPSNRFKRLMPHILGVPGFEGVRFHSGATAADTEGCILVGDRVAPDGISISGGLARKVFDAFFVNLQKALTQGDVFVTITNEE